MSKLNNVISGSPPSSVAGEITFSVTASDNLGGSSVKLFNFTIADIQPPVILSLIHI